VILHDNQSIDRGSKKSRKKVPTLNEKLLDLSNRHATEMSHIVDRASEAALDAYRVLEGVDEGTRYSELRKAILEAVANSRRAARDAAVSHILAELALVSGSQSSPSIDVAIDPLSEDMEQYADNAVTAAQDADAQELGIASTGWWAERIIESEAFRTYDHSRRVAESTLAGLAEDDALSYGFKIATQSDIESRASEDDDPNLIVLLGKMWNAVNDKRTCQQCASLDGSISLPGFDYAGGVNPPAHARCRCVSTLWAVGYLKGMYAMNEIQTRGEDLRFACDLDLREIDSGNRVIRNATASDESLDSHGTKFRAEGWDLQRFRKNPVLLWNHNSKGGPENVLGRVEARVDSIGKRLAVDLHFAPPGENPLADMVWGQIQRKEVSGLSVGFRPKRYHFENTKGAKDEVMVFDEATLSELSVVPVPSNENTIIKQVRSMIEECGCGDNAIKPEVSGSDTETPCQRQEGLFQMDKSPSIPAGLAAVLGTDDPEEIKQRFAKSELRIAQLEKLVEDAKSEAKEAKEALDSYRNSAADQAVEEYIQLGLLKEESRATAQSFARADLGGFTAMYAEQKAEMAKRSAPKASLLEQVVQSQKPSKPQAKPFASTSRQMAEIARKLRNDNPRLSLEDAYSRAYDELIGKE